MQGYIVIQHKISISKIHVLHIFTPKGVLVGQCGELFGQQIPINFQGRLDV